MKKLITGGGVIAVATLAWMTAAVGWQPPTLSVRGAGCETAEVVVHNGEQGSAKVTASNVFTVGATVPGNGNLTATVHGTEDFYATVTLNYPDHGTAAPALVTFDECPVETTTTTAPEPTTTGPPITVVAPPAPEEVTPRFTG